MLAAEVGDVERELDGSPAGKRQFFVHAREGFLEEVFAEDPVDRLALFGAETVFVADLQVVGGGIDPLAHDDMGDVSGHDHDPAADFGGIVERIEGAADTDGFPLSLFGDPLAVGARDAVVELDARLFPGVEELLVGLGLSEGMDVVAPETFLESFADAGELLDGDRLDEGVDIPDFVNAEGFGVFRGQLGDPFGRGDPDGDGDVEGPFDRFLELTGEVGAFCLVDPSAQVSEKFVDTVLLHLRDLFFHERVDLTGESVVERIVGGYDHHLGTELQGLGDGHGGLDAAGTGFVAGGGDDAPDLLSAVDPVDEVGGETLLAIAVEDRGDEGPAVVVHQSDMAALPVEDLQVAPAAYGHGDVFQGGIDGTLGGGEKAVDIDVEEHA